ncbi:MAG: hypothetical protein AABW54_03405 [Candidatus Micrarchaeota archaeon]
MRCVEFVEYVEEALVGRVVISGFPVELHLLFDAVSSVDLPRGGSGPGGGIAGVRLSGVGDALVAADAKLVNCLNAVNSYKRSKA